MERIAVNGLPHDAEQISGVQNIQKPEPKSVPSANAGMYKKMKMMEDLVAREHASNPKTLALARNEEEEYRKTMRQQIEKIVKRTEKVTRQAPAYNKACLDEESLTAEEFSRKKAIVLQKLRCKAREVRENN